MVAMYMNNRAAEALAAGRIDDAYWWAREAVRQRPVPGRVTTRWAWSTSATATRARGRARRSCTCSSASRPTRRRWPTWPRCCERAGARRGAARSTRARADSSRTPPFHYFNRGMAAMRAGDYARRKRCSSARSTRARLLPRVPLLARASRTLGLGDVDDARKHLAIAMKNSTTRNERDLYAAKLAWLQAHADRQSRPAPTDTDGQISCRAPEAAPGRPRCRSPARVPSNAKPSHDRFESRAGALRSGFGFASTSSRPVAADRGQQVGRSGRGRCRPPR